MQEIKKIFSVVPEKNASQMDKYRNLHKDPKTPVRN